jgi:hypothetical protein
MTPVSMAETEREPGGAPVPKDYVDPELIKLSRPTWRVGVITAAGLVFLSLFFLLRMNSDRRFGGSEEPTRTTVADVLAGKVSSDAFVSLDAEPLVAHAIRTNASKGSLGLRVAPARGTGEKLWIVLNGDGWAQVNVGPYVGRLRKLSDMPFASAVGDYAATHPRPVFAAASALRAGLSSGKVATVTGETVTVGAADRVAFDVVEPNTSVIVCAFDERYPNAAAWTKALTDAGITANGAPQATTEQAKFEVTGSPSSLTQKLQAANLWAARVEPVTHHFETTWSALAGSSPAGFTVNGTTIPDGELDLVGLYVARGIPSDAYALITGEKPADYWYVLPVSIALAIIALVFAWALVRAVRRDLIPARVS